MNAPDSTGRLAIRARVDGCTGYGNIAEWVGRSLEAAGHPVAYDLVVRNEQFMPLPAFVAERAVPAGGTWKLHIGTPGDRFGVGRRLMFTMWESSGLSESYVRKLDNSAVVVVPCRYNAECFAAAGVTVPIRLAPLGVSASDGYTPKPYAGRPFTFGMAARMQHGGVRKGLNEGMAAFVKAFDLGQDVRLRLKVYEDCLPALRVPDDARISVATEPLRADGMARWYESIDCLFVPSKGEGWGLHTLQAMACGRPVIAARHSGTAEFFDGRFGWELPFDLSPAGEFYRGMGDWAVPSEDGMVSALRAAHADRDGCRSRGAAAARHAAGFGWDRTAAGLIAAAREAGLPMPFRSCGPGKA